MYSAPHWIVALSIALILFLAPYLLGNETAGTSSGSGEAAAQPTPALSGLLRQQIVQQIKAAVLRDIRKDVAKIIAEEIQKANLRDTVALLVNAEASKRRLQLVREGLINPLELKEMGVGQIKGKVFWNGKPLAKCLIKVRRIRQKRFGDPTMPVPRRKEFLAMSNPDGTYEFKSLPAGHYQLLWKAPQQSSWIRHLSKRADIVVTRAKTTSPENLEANVRTLN